MLDGSPNRGMKHHPDVPSLASKSLMFRRLVPTFLRRSGYSQRFRNLAQVPHFGFTLSHFSFLPRHDIHDIVFSPATGLSLPVAVVEFGRPCSLVADEDVGSCSTAPASGEPGPEPDPDPDIYDRKVCDNLTEERFQSMQDSWVKNQVMTGHREAT
jgi:hypothetical protein